MTGLFDPVSHTTPLNSGPVTGGGTLEVHGTGFVANLTTVNFVGTSPTQNLILAGTSVNVTSPTVLTVTIPAATTLTPPSYYVVVTTPNGTSASIAASQYTYSPTVPTVTGVTTASGSATGSAAGGSTVIISGTGFLSPTGGSTTVEFVDTQNAGNVYTSPSNSISVNSSGTQVTAVTPAISSTDLTYYVQVLTAPGGLSLPGLTFVYVPLLPLAASVYATQGAGGTQVTITGVGFVTSSTTVQLVPSSGSGTLTLTGVAVTGSTSLVGTVPNGGTVNRVYYVQVTTPSGSSSAGNGAPQFTYT